MKEGNRRRGRPRDPGAEEAIGRATLALLDEQGYAGLTMASVAERARVAKTTIYRRWPTKADMVLDAIAAEVDGHAVDDLQNRLEALNALVVEMHRRVHGPWHRPGFWTQLLRHDDVREPFIERFIWPLRTRAIALVSEAMEAKILRDDLAATELVDLLVAALVGEALLPRPAAPRGPQAAHRLFALAMSGALEQAGAGLGPGWTDEASCRDF
jgi:AcrR family transcriptional regulator